MREDTKHSGVDNIIAKKIDEINAESRMKDSSPEEKIHKSLNLQLTEKLNLSSIQPTMYRALPTVPSPEPTDEQSLPRIPYNEIKKVIQRPRRILPCLPQVVQELLRWSIHPQQVLRGAASVSHLWNLPTIEEENLQSAYLTDTIVQPKSPRVKQILSSVPPTENRTLPSKHPSPAGKPLPKFRAELRKRMLPSLPTIKEQTSSRLQEGEKAPPNFQPEEKEPQPSRHEKFSGVKMAKKERRQRRKYTRVNEDQARLQPAPKEAMAPTVQPKVSRTRPTLLSADSYALLNFGRKDSNQLPRLKAKLARRSETLFQPSEKEKNSRPLSMKPALTSIQPTQESVIPKPPSTPKPTVTRTRPKIQVTANRPLPSTQQTQGPKMQKPPSSPKPTASRTRPKIQATASRPLPSIQPQIQGPMIPKPPSTPKPAMTRTYRKTQATANLPLSNNQPMIKHDLPSLRSSRLQKLVKQPLPSVKLEENYHSGARVVELNVDNNL